MKVSSRKAKGRALQNMFRDMILRHFPELTKEDVRSAIMGETGEDIKLSLKARDALGIVTECKNQEGFGKIYSAYEQAYANWRKIAETDFDDYTPIAVVKQNRHIPLVVLAADDFLRILKDARRSSG